MVMYLIFETVEPKTYDLQKQSHHTEVNNDYTVISLVINLIKKRNINLDVSMCDHF